MAFAAFDLLEIDSHSALAEPWTARRKRLEDLLDVPPPGICLVPVTEDAPALWDAWVGLGGEGIVLKERTSPYRPRPGSSSNEASSGMRYPLSAEVG
jgi:ATP-dependent DNA ligase